MESNFNKRLEQEMLSASINPLAKYTVPYDNSSERKNVYEKLQKNDIEFSRFITKTYGSYENYLYRNRISLEQAVFDPSTDFLIETVIVKPQINLKTDHISTQELLMELMSGICTVYFIKKTNGAARRMSCTLTAENIPTSEKKTRINFFSPLPGQRVGVWDVDENKWKSFYMGSVYKFVRDDSIAIE